MSAVAEMQARLLCEGTPYRLVEGGMELAAVKDNAPKATPAAYVLVSRDASAPNERATGPVLQRMERDIMVVYVLRHVARPQAAAGGDELTELIDWSREQLIGFRPSDTAGKLTHVGGEVVEVRNGHVWFEDTFSAPTYLREKSS